MGFSMIGPTRFARCRTTCRWMTPALLRELNVLLLVRAVHAMAGKHPGTAVLDGRVDSFVVETYQ